MKFPITRASLQAFDQNTENVEKKKQCIQRMLDCDITAICNDVATSMPIYSLNKKCVWREIQNQRRFRSYGVDASPHIGIDEYLPHIISKLEATFIGCDIIIDPLKIYIVIDWS